MVGDTNLGENSTKLEDADIHLWRAIHAIWQELPMVERHPATVASEINRRMYHFLQELAKETHDEMPQLVEESYMHQQKRLHAKAYAAWSEAEDAQLCDEVATGLSVPEIAKRHQRNSGAIHSRMRKLGLEA